MSEDFVLPATWKAADSIARTQVAVGRLGTPRRAKDGRRAELDCTGGAGRALLPRVSVADIRQSTSRCSPAPGRVPAGNKRRLVCEGRIVYGCSCTCLRTRRGRLCDHSTQCTQFGTPRQARSKRCAELDCEPGSVLPCKPCIP